MEDVSKRKPKKRPRVFSQEFKAEVVFAALKGDRSMAQVARDFDVHERSVRDWLSQAESIPNRPESEAEELRRLRKENARLKEDIGILKRATAFFAKETR